MRKIFLMLGAVAALATTSCKKDENKNPNPGPGGGATKFVKKMTEVTDGVTTVYNVQYDANKRLRSIVSADEKESTVITYDAAGRPTQIVSLEEGTKQDFTFTYDANGVPQKATVKSWDLEQEEPELVQDDVLIYTVQNGKVTKIKQQMKLDDAEVDFELSYTNGNLTRVESLLEQFKYTATYTYGNKRPLFPPVSNYVLDQGGFSLLLFAKNEVTTVKLNFPVIGLDKQINTQYTYDAAGYILTSDDGETKTTYEYQ